MNRDVFIKGFGNLKLIAHRMGYKMTDYPENSIMALKTIFSNEELLKACSGFEFDICFTKDHIPVVIHDKYIDDISDGIGLINKYNICELKKIKFCFRKSVCNDNSNLYSFSISTLEEVLSFFNSNFELLDGKIIKFETKDAYRFSKENLNSLASVIIKYPLLTNNLVHLSYFPQNLIILRKIQQIRGYPISKTDLLCDFKFMVNISKVIKNLDYVSFRVQSYNLAENNNKNSKRVNRKLKFDRFMMRLSNATSLKTLQYAVNRFGSVNLYVINDYSDIDKLSKILNDYFFEKYSDKIFITTDNPVYLKKLF